MELKSNNDIVEKFKNRFNKQPDLVIQAPGRINLIGEHTDYNGGLVLPAAIDKYIYFAFSDNGTNEQFNIIAEDFQDSISFAKNELSKSSKHWANYLIGILDQLMKKGYDIKGADCLMSSTIPIGSGLSSSAALDCGFLRGILELNNIEMDLWSQAELAKRSDNEFLGIKSGILDQFASIFGQENKALKMNCGNHHFEAIPIELKDSAIVLINTNVKHTHLTSGYNTCAQECLESLQIIREQFPDIQSLSDISTDMLAECKKSLPQKLWHRVSYIIEENERVERFCIAMKEGKINLMGRLLNQSHEGLRIKYKVSCDELDLLVDLSQNEPNVYGARMMGGGFGGCAIILLKNDSKMNVARRIARNYKEITKIQPEIYYLNIVDGVKRIM